MISARRSTQAGLCRHHKHDSGHDDSQVWRRAPLQVSVDAPMPSRQDYPQGRNQAPRHHRGHQDAAGYYHKLPLQRSLMDNTANMRKDL